MTQFMERKGKAVFSGDPWYILTDKPRDRLQCILKKLMQTIMLFETLKVNAILRNFSIVFISQQKEPESDMKHGKEGKMLLFLAIFRIFQHERLLRGSVFGCISWL